MSGAIFVSDRLPQYFKPISDELVQIARDEHHCLRIKMKDTNVVEIIKVSFLASVNHISIVRERTDMGKVLVTVKQDINMTSWNLGKAREVLKRCEYDISTKEGCEALRALVLSVTVPRQEYLRGEHAIAVPATKDLPFFVKHCKEKNIILYQETGEGYKVTNSLGQSRSISSKLFKENFVCLD